MTKNNTGIKSILNIHTPRRVAVAKKPRPSVQEMLDHEDLMNLYDPNWFIPDPSLDKPEDTSKATPKIKKERTDKKYRYGSALQWLTRPKATEQEIQDKEFWDGYNNSEKMLKYINKYGDGPKITAPKKYPVTPEHYTDRIEDQDRKQKARNNKPRDKTDG